MAELSKTLERRDTGEPTRLYVFKIIALVRLVPAATVREQRLFHSAFAQVRLLLESGIYSRAASIRSYTVHA